MPLPTLRNKQEYFGIRREETLTKEKSLCFQNFDPDERKPKNILSVVDSPLNDSLMMLEDLAQDIKVRKNTKYMVDEIFTIPKNEKMKTAWGKWS